MARNDNEFWAISKELANLNVYKWDNDINIFIEYQHNIKIQKYYHIDYQLVLIKKNKIYYIL